MSAVIPGNDPGVLYQYYWIKAATEQEVDAYRKKLMAKGLPPTHAEPFDGGVIKEKRTVEDTRPLDGGVIQEKSVKDQPLDGGVIKRKELISRRPTPTDGGVVPTPNAHPLGAGLNVVLGMLVSQEHSRKKKMMADMRVMPFGWTRQDAEAWIETTDAQDWASGAFCMLAFIAIKPR